MDEDVPFSLWMSIFHINDERIEFRPIPRVDLYVAANKSRNAQSAPDTWGPPPRSLVLDPVNRRGNRKGMNDPRRSGMWMQYHPVDI